MSTPFKTLQNTTVNANAWLLCSTVSSIKMCSQLQNTRDLQPKSVSCNSSTPYPQPYSTWDTTYYSRVNDLTVSFHHNPHLVSTQGLCLLLGCCTCPQNTSVMHNLLPRDVVALVQIAIGAQHCSSIIHSAARVLLRQCSVPACLYDVLYCSAATSTCQ